MLFLAENGLLRGNTMINPYPNKVGSFGTKIHTATAFYSE